MRSAVVQIPSARTASEARQVWRAAVRQLERADLYLAAVAHMPIDDGELDLAVRKLRSDLESLRRYLLDSRKAELE
ncbi:MAG TPA: hypothetical protein VEU76_02530 [Candidatus Udaeobacter sp.]|nr:hypothetical protein [Candidatus Udaeobacter sp.]